MATIGTINYLMETIIFTKKNVNTSQKEGFNLQYNVSNGTAAATSPAKLNIYYPSNPRYVITYPWYKSYRRCYHHKIKRCYLEMNYLIGSTSTQNEYIDILLFFVEIHTHIYSWNEKIYDFKFWVVGIKRTLKIHDNEIWFQHQN